jgi:uncharacterized membrane protein YphA (DoxX/SURF4 family)
MKSVASYESKCDPDLRSPIPRSNLAAHVAVALPPLVGAVFMLAAFAKLIRPEATLDALAWSVGSPLAMPLLVMLIAFEAVVGLLLICSFATRVAAPVAAAALLVFSVFLVLKHLFGPAGACGCGTEFILGDSMASSLTFNLVRNGLLIVFLLPATVRSVREIRRHAID